MAQHFCFVENGAFIDPNEPARGNINEKILLETHVRKELWKEPDSKRFGFLDVQPEGSSSILILYIRHIYWSLRALLLLMLCCFIKNFIKFSTGHVYIWK